MNKYEAMFIVKPDLSEEERKNLFNQIAEAVTKNNGAIINSCVWADRRKLYFPIKKHHEGMYYLLNFNLPPLAVKEIRNVYKLNENILRVLISNLK
ncbi:MAG: 30S ribosomal protein S6 [Candidatus Omnitrophica bacterium]|nr:30S ribosomal protein S6 [Candidatus Omnitrophota bacterium]MBU1868934.1 30S ribosomal protein S6 [Candidatus Omnitrophota bacterium]